MIAYRNVSFIPFVTGIDNVETLVTYWFIFAHADWIIFCPYKYFTMMCTPVIISFYVMLIVHRLCSKQDVAHAALYLLGGLFVR